MVRFDAYTATTTGAKHDDLAQVLMDKVGLGNLCQAEIRQSKGFHTFGHRMGFSLGGHEFAAIQWGGKQGERVMLEVKGEHTPAVVEGLRARFDHRVTRVDSCADFDVPGAFAALLEPSIEVKKARKIMGGKAGDWDDFPKKGRTLYLVLNPPQSVCASTRRVCSLSTCTSIGRTGRVLKSKSVRQKKPKRPLQVCRPWTFGVLHAGHGT